jgi:hypothetical protein
MLSFLLPSKPKSRRDRRPRFGRCEASATSADLLLSGKPLQAPLVNLLGKAVDGILVKFDEVSAVDLCLGRFDPRTNMIQVSMLVCFLVDEILHSLFDDSNSGH